MKLGPLKISWINKAKERSAIMLKDTPGDPAENSTDMIEIMVDGFKYIRERTDEQLVYFGRVFSVALFIEHKIERILIGYDPHIERKMLGEKIKVYKEFLNELKRIEPNHPVDFGFQFLKYEKSKQALVELNKIRRKYAHSVEFDYIRRESIRNLSDFNKTERVDLWETVPESLPDDLYVIGQLYVFGFCFSHATTELINAQEVESGRNGD